MTLHYYSSSAYKHVRQRFNKNLPHPRTLSRTYGVINAEPGYTVESFNVLKVKVNASKMKIVCSLVFDEMSIRQQKIWDGKKNIGLVDIGLSSQESDQIATQALVFMVVSLQENWKIPVG